MAILLALSPSLAHAEGPGLGNFAYEGSELFQPIAVIHSPRGHGRIAMVNGYLMVIYSSDGGGSSADGGIEFWDVSDPRDPKLVVQHDNADTHGLREPHGFSLSPSYGGVTLAAQAVEGIQLWDLTDPMQAHLLSYLDLPGISRADYGGDWWLSWRAPHLYVAGVGSGLYIVDVHDPTAPTLLRRMAPAELGGINPGVVYAIGNRLVISEHLSGHHATLDISDPDLPVLLDTAAGGNGYSHTFAGGYILTSGGNGSASDMFVHQVDADGQISALGSVNSTLGNGGYGSFQDGFFISGFSTGVAKFDVANMKLMGSGSSNLEGRDEDFGIVLGNLMWGGSDHDVGSALIVHQTEPDNRPPTVTKIYPADGAAGVGLKTGIGVSMSDNIDVRSVGDDTFWMRPIGGSGVPLSGRYSVTDGLVNFVPSEPLAPLTTYEVTIAGVRDWAGNAAGTFSSTFATSDGTSGTAQLECGIEAMVPAKVGDPVEFRYAGGRTDVQFSWEFGDGAVLSESSTLAEATHSYSEPGRYVVILSVLGAGGFQRCSGIQIVHHPKTTTAPASSSTVVWHGGYAYAVNPDHDTIAAIDDATLTLAWESKVGHEPRTLAVGPGPGGAQSLWVVNQGDATITIVSLSDGTVLDRIELPHASQPYGIAFDAEGTAYVTLEARGELVALDRSGDVLATTHLGPRPHAIGITSDERVLVTRFVSSPDAGEIWEVDPASMTKVSTHVLGLDEGPDTERSGRGVPNYLNQVVTSPDGKRAVIPSKKDNVQRGLYRDGQELTFESRVRTIASQFELDSGLESVPLRLDFNDRDMAQAAAFSPAGDILMVAFQGTNVVEFFDSRDGRAVGRVNAGRAPQGLTLNADGTRLYVQNYLSRSVSVFDTSELVTARSNEAPLLAEVTSAKGEPLSAEELHGKKMFYDASDERMSKDGYISCASCHLDGRDDGQVWDFTQAGEGLRNTISLIGRGGMGHGRVHWTANFDEIQDFENDIRLGFGGRGYLSDADFERTLDPLGAPKAGLSEDLDALAAYVSSLDQFPPSPYRNGDGTLTETAMLGQRLFAEYGCDGCHSGERFTDLERHDVGTIGPGSGQGQGKPLDGVGFDTPTLRGVWATAPYFHDGSADTLLEVMERHGSEVGSAEEAGQIIAYLEQIDGPTPGEFEGSGSNSNAGGGGAEALVPEAGGNGPITGGCACRATTSPGTSGLAWLVVGMMGSLCRRRGRRSHRRS